MELKNLFHVKKKQKKKTGFYQASVEKLSKRKKLKLIA